MVDVDILKHISLAIHDVSKITPQVSMIPNNVLLMRDHHLFYMKKLQLSKVDVSKVHTMPNHDFHDLDTM
jgi:hypothetical protein